MFTILIVENNAAFRRSLKEVIGVRFPALDVAEASNAEEAFLLVQTMPPALIFTDVSLSGENGFELTRRIKGDHPQVRVVVLSSHDLDEYRDAAYECGADGFFAKDSSTWDELAALIEAMVGEKGHDKGGSEVLGG